MDATAMPRLYGDHLVKTVKLMDVCIVSLVIDGVDRLCLAQISNTLLHRFSYNEIHNRRVALGITCLQCTPVQLEMLRRVGAMPVSSRRCGMITYREADRLCKSFLCKSSAPLQLPEECTFQVKHNCAWGCQGIFFANKYTSSRAKCVECLLCHLLFSPNKFIFHSHPKPNSLYVQTDAANFNAWRRHLHLNMENTPESVLHWWEDVKCMFNGGSRKRASSDPQVESADNKTTQSKQSTSGHVKSASTAVSKPCLTLNPATPRMPAPRCYTRPLFDPALAYNSAAFNRSLLGLPTLWPWGMSVYNSYVNQCTSGRPL